MRTVIDCSVAFQWEVNEPGTAKALRLRDDCRNGLVELLAPDIFPVEVANALYTAELQGKIASGRFYQRLIDVLHANPVLYQSTSLLPRASIIIRRATIPLPIYDCLYVALAEREGCDLVTADKKLVRALGAAYPFIIDLATMP